MLNYYNQYQGNQVIRVTGEAGAKAYQLGPNSSILLLDETAPLVWLVQTDGAGYKTLSPYKIEPYKPEPAPDVANLIKRIDELETKLNESNTTGFERQQNKSNNKAAEKC